MQGVKGHRPSPRRFLPRHKMVESIVDRRCLPPPHRDAPFFKDVALRSLMMCGIMWWGYGWVWSVGG